MSDWTKQRALITVRTYPVPSASSVEASCTAAITTDGRWLRLFPVPWRLMDHDRRFRKWQWIEVSTIKASDPRPESYKIDPNSIVIGETVGPEREWAERRRLLSPLRQSSMCRIQRERDEHGAPTLGFFRPHQITRLIIDPAESKEWTLKQKAQLTQGDLFEKGPAQTLEKLPFDFRYEFRCGDINCNGHRMLCTDWEMGQSFRDWSDKYGDDWERAFRKKYEKEMIEKFDTHFFVGTIHQHPSRWIIVGIFYPPKREADLFDRP